MITPYKRNNDTSLDTCKVHPTFEEVENTADESRTEIQNSYSKATNDCATDVEDQYGGDKDPYSPLGM